MTRQLTRRTPTLSLAVGWTLAGFKGDDGLGKARRPNILVAIAGNWSHEHAGAHGCCWIKAPCCWIKAPRI